MQRLLFLPVLVLALVAVARADDVEYIDRGTKKEVTVTKVKITDESASGIKIEITKGKEVEKRTIAPGDIVQITYTLSDVAALEYRKPFGKLRRAMDKSASAKVRATALADALSGFEDLEGKARGNANARRYLQYMAALTAVEMARDEARRPPDPKTKMRDTTKRDAAIKLLEKFAKDHVIGWQIVPALKTLAAMQQEAGKPDEARKAFEALAKIPDAPKEVKQESQLLVGRFLLRGAKPNYAEAEKMLKSLDGDLSATDLHKPFVQAYLAEAQLGQKKTTGVDKELKAALKASTDSKLRGLVHNLLGDFHRLKNQNGEAFWHYLRVDALYNDDPEEQAKALYYLSSLFDSVKKDPLRGKDCMRRLLEKGFDGTRYQALAKKK